MYIFQSFVEYTKGNTKNQEKNVLNTSLIWLRREKLNELLVKFLVDEDGDEDG